ncbi:nucleotidyltransferase domain-containing protein [Streptosporangium sp. NBC_01755]|uniref:DNA polymerase beta superfamily protein n=1 Tax=unclassified Streptosporangium TaxID=2632669 RepID=UPI002DDA79E2|nr:MULTISPECIES: nucleotidyltransferase domain-containing protein [unclassified Streptosporangium]WSA28949.1 nucleotidyltransferase domain-containing protein [Streptosporangium sp. NBC_01810]WSC99604.1 nucleotidyltransferase domain-containing protein [Streptosporangium sp. NBC_01755]
MEVRYIPDHSVLSVVVGSRAYGLESEDSDVDLRGVHLLPLEEVVGLRTGELEEARDVSRLPDTRRRRTRYTTSSSASVSQREPRGPDGRRSTGM